MTTISPGCTSRSKVAPTLSKAHVSEASIQPSPSRPSASGRLPRAPRMPMSWRCVAMTRLNEPRSLGMTVGEPVGDVLAGRVGDQLGDDGGVRGDPAGVVIEHRVAAQLEGVDDVAVVGHRDGPDGVEARAAVRAGPGRAGGG